MQVAALTHDTEPRPLLTAPGTAGMVSTCQAVPSHRSATAWPPALPTAMHFAAAGQEIPPACCGGAGRTRQRRPFQASANGLAKKPATPIATQLARPAHDTALSWCACAGPGVLSTRHPVPSQISLYGCVVARVAP